MMRRLKHGYRRSQGGPKTNQRVLGERADAFRLWLLQIRFQDHDGDDGPSGTINLFIFN